MEVVQVQGTDMDPSHYDPRDWTQVLRAQAKLRETRNATHGTNADPSVRETPSQSREPPQTATTPGLHSSSTQLRVLHTTAQKIKQLPPLPPDGYKVVFRSQGGLDFTTLQPRYLLTALMQAAALTDPSTLTLRIHPINNTCTVSAVNQEGVLKLVQLQHITYDQHEYAMMAYIAPPDGSVRGVITNAYWKESPQELLADLISPNPHETILDARRMGLTPSILITFGQATVPPKIVYGGGLHLCTPYTPRVETCSNCRAIGHRTDARICPGTQECKHRHLPKVTRPTSPREPRSQERVDNSLRGASTKRSEPPAGQRKGQSKTDKLKTPNGTRPPATNTPPAPDPRDQELRALRVEAMATLDALLQRIHRIAGRNPLLIGGDFNSQHTDWGYRYTTARGRGLWTTIHDLSLTTHNFHTPTPIGNSVTMDTIAQTSHSAVLSKISHGLVHNTHLEATIIFSPYKYLSHHTDPDSSPRILFTGTLSRSARRELPNSPIQDIDDWVSSLLNDITAHTQHITTPPDAPTLDTRLAHLWEAHRSILERWKPQKHNRTLKRRLATLHTQITARAEELCRSNWGQVCNSIAGNLSTKYAWHLLRHLINPTNSRTTSQHRIARLLHNTTLSPDSLLDQLRTTHTAPGTSSLSRPTREPRMKPWTTIYRRKRSAFDRVEHRAIMAALSPLNVGVRMYAYIQAFLSGRTAEVHMGPHASPPYTLSGVEVDTIRILGLHIQNNGRNTFTIRILKRVTEALSHLISALSWCASVQTLHRKYGFLARTEDEAAERNTAIRTLVRQAENAQWSANAQRKTTMALYCEHKGEISAEPLYDNSVCSTLLFEARAGALRTLSYQRHFDTDPDVQMALCRVCGSDDDETQQQPYSSGAKAPIADDGSAATRALRKTKTRLHFFAPRQRTLSPE
ncbi:hypothetical protein HPB52_009699 [Rhipicephalus sanguineus]|uniref:Endonuclease/exonuclease/phosphatase domain-containing protein n=1 Tax=Rhipicephalus sanguineus TaxID=34632 RepID=A0A9D4T979_RHISA|nr:hypothetical protein HPB52_009699 [Rhipicephalus sanguineus]